MSSQTTPALPNEGAPIQPEVSADYSWEELFVGQTASFSHSFSEQDLATFAQLSGDLSPLHTSDSYAERHGYKQTLLHGLLTASLISRLLGMHLPGRRNICQSESLDYVHPAYPGEILNVHGKIIEKNEALRVAVIRVEIRKQDGELVLRGRAQVGVRND